MDLGRLAPASEVTVQEDIPFLKGHGLPILKGLDGQDPFQICGGLCQTRKTLTLVHYVFEAGHCKQKQTFTRELEQPRMY
jgi:hypothetical protein